MMHSQRDRLCEHLQRVPYFAGLDAAVLCELASLRGPLHAAAYVLLGVSLVAAAWETGVISVAALRRAEQGAAQAA